MVTTFRSPVSALLRYIANRGGYPWRTILRTPLGRVPVTMWSRHDLLTINEIFCRRDYGSDAHRTVVDIGGNCGYATLFFLTRDHRTRVWVYEPDPANVERLHETLAGFHGRYRLAQMAVTADDVSSVRFVPQGRYGHVARSGEGGVEVPAISIAAVLRAVTKEAEEIDLLKIDTEGTEPELVRALPADAPVREVRYEDVGRVVVHRPSRG